MRQFKRSTYQFIESIRLEDGRPQLLAYHEDRIRHSLRMHFMDHPLLDRSLATYFSSAKRSGRYKWRVVVTGQEVLSTYMPYEMKPYTALKPVAFHGSYAHKYEARAALDACMDQVDEGIWPLLHRGGRLMDTVYANVALRYADKWYTPMYPLLHGVMRAYLIHRGVIEMRDLHLLDLYDCDEVAAFNALVPWEDAWRFCPSDLVR